MCYSCLVAGGDVKSVWPSEDIVLESLKRAQEAKPGVSALNFGGMKGDCKAEKPCGQDTGGLPGYDSGVCE